VGIVLKVTAVLYFTPFHYKPLTFYLEARAPGRTRRTHFTIV